MVWSTSDGRLLLRIVPIDDERWAVVHPSGRFAASDPEDLGGASWVFPDNPRRPLDLAIFLRDYFTPQPVEAGARREDVRGAPAAGGVNRSSRGSRTPRSGWRGTKPSSPCGSRRADNRDVFGEGPRRRTMASDAFDLRLSRDGQLVWQHPDPDTDPSEDLTVRTEAQRSPRAAHVVTPNAGDGWFATSLRVPLPHNAGGRPVRFTAYCFNRDRVKSRTAEAVVFAPAGLERVPAPRFPDLRGGRRQPDPRPGPPLRRRRRPPPCRIPRPRLQGRGYRGRAGDPRLRLPGAAASRPGRRGGRHARQPRCGPRPARRPRRRPARGGAGPAPDSARTLPRSGPDDLVVLFSPGTATPTRRTACSPCCPMTSATTASSSAAGDPRPPGGVPPDHPCGVSMAAGWRGGCGG